MNVRHPAGVFAVTMEANNHDYGTNYEILSSKISSLFEQIKNSNVISLLSVLLEGEPGCGKTALASYLALHSGFPYVKIISPESLVKYMENGKYPITLYSSYKHAG